MNPKDILSGVAIVVSICTFGLSLWFAWRSSIAAKRPVLVFVYDGRTGWVLRNIGGGPALNVIVAQKCVGDEWFNPVRVPPFAKDAEFALRWLGHVNTTGLGATYTTMKIVPILPLVEMISRGHSEGRALDHGAKTWLACIGIKLTTTSSCRRRRCD